MEILTLPPDRVISVTPFCKSDTAMNEDFESSSSLSALFGFVPRKWKETLSREACDTGGAIEVMHSACSREQWG